MPAQGALAATLHCEGSILWDQLQELMALLGAVWHNPLKGN